MSLEVQWATPFMSSGGVYPESELAPHRRLRLRIWWRAVCDYVLYKGRSDHRSKVLANDAAEWLFGETCACSPACIDSDMSFDAFCEEFGLSQDNVRNWITKLSRSEINQIGRNLP